MGTALKRKTKYDEKQRKEQVVRFSPEEVATIIAEKLGIDDLTYFWSDVGISVFGEGLECDQCDHALAAHSQNGQCSIPCCGCRIKWCESCGENPVTHLQAGYDVTPTDRGDWRQYEERHVCDECDP